MIGKLSSVAPLPTGEPATLPEPNNVDESGNESVEFFLAALASGHQ